MHSCIFLKPNLSTDRYPKELFMKVAVFGDGNVGARLSQLIQEAGHQVLVCTRTGSSVLAGYTACSFQEGAQQADIVMLASPYSATHEVLSALGGALHQKIVVDCTNPLNADWSPLVLGAENSAAETIAQQAPQARLVKAFNTIFADVMPRSQHDRAGHTISAFVASDDAHAKATVMALASEMGFAPVDAGPLRCARYLEAMAHLNIQIAVGQGGGTHAAFIYHQVKA
jgi:predicted dinucleotide-binding enzyme